MNLMPALLRTGRARVRLAFLSALLFCITFSAFAFAQVLTGTAPTVTTISVASVVIASLSVLAGYAVQAVNTGSLFGIATLPKLWLPYCSLLASFLAAFLTSIGSSPSGAASWVNALLAGLVSLAGNGAGVTIHQHLNAHKLDSDASAPPKAAAPTHAVGPLTGMLGAMIVAGVLVVLFGAVSPSRSLKPVIAIESQGCSWWNGGGNTQTATAAEQFGSCVMGQVLVSGVTSVPAILLQCGIADTPAFVAIVESIIAAYAQPPTLDSGLSAGTLCLSGPPPYKGAPQCLSIAQLAALRAVHDSAVGSAKASQ